MFLLVGRNVNLYVQWRPGPGADPTPSSSSQGMRSPRHWGSKFFPSTSAIWQTNEKLVSRNFTNFNDKFSTKLEIESDWTYVDRQMLRWNTCSVRALLHGAIEENAWHLALQKKISRIDPAISTQRPWFRWQLLKCTWIQQKQRSDP